MVQNELGDLLRRAREDKHWSPEDAERATGIRRRFIQAMEEGRWDVLPSPIQVRGFLKSYAGHLGLKPDEVIILLERQTRLAQTSASLQVASPDRPVTVTPKPPAAVRPPAANVQPNVTQPARATAPSAQHAPATLNTSPVIPVSSPVVQAGKLPLPAWLTLERGLIILAVILFICVFILVISMLVMPPAAAPAAQPVATRTMRPSPSEADATPVLPIAAGAIPASPSDNITASLKPTPAPNFVEVALTATEHGIWVRVRTDGKTAFEAMLEPGKTLKWEAKEIIVIEASNGAGLTGSANGKTVSTLGPRGQVVARAWTPAGETTVPPTPAASLSTP